MANRTASYASTVHGTNPQYLIEKIIRLRIQESKYWKEHCTLLNSALVLEKAVDDLRFVGGVIGGNVKPTPFLCLTLKLLQIQPNREIIYLYIEQPDFKYLRALGAFYLRLIGSAVEVYTKLEPLYKDYRKLRTVDRTNKFATLHMDELIDNLLRDERVFDVILPRLTKRHVLEANRDIKPYKSELEELNLLPEQMIQERAEQVVQEDTRNLHYRSRRDDRFSESNSRKDHHHHQGRSQYHRHKPDSKEARGSHQEPVRKGRFRQEEIDNENSIRAKLGLKPLH